MKKILLTFLLSIILKFCIYSQQYYQIPDSLASWDCVFEDYFNPGVYDLKRYESKGDTIVNQKSYIKIYSTLKVTYNRADPIHPNPYIIKPIDSTKTLYRLLRKTNDQKVFEIIDTTEYLLYDFSLKINDSLKIPKTDIYYYKVINIDSIQINNSYRKRIEVITNFNGGFDFNYYWIEGIGCTSGLFAEESIQGEFSNWYLSCFKIDSIVNFSQGNYPCYDFSNQSLQVKNNVIINDIIIYPVPIVDISHVIFSNNHKYRYFNIYDVNLRKIIDSNVTNMSEAIINRIYFKPGIYFVELIDYAGNRSTRKINVE